jgi:hypothetical protein
MPRALLHTATHYRTEPRALPHTTALPHARALPHSHTLPHCRTLPHCCTLQHCSTLPHTAAKPVTAALYRSAAHCRGHCHITLESTYIQGARYKWIKYKCMAYSGLLDINRKTLHYLNLSTSKYNSITRKMNYCII